MRFSLRWLFITILIIALCIVPLLNANIYWANAAERCRLLLLSFTIVAAIYARGSARAFWIGASVFGWIDAKHLVGQQIDDKMFDWLFTLVVREREVVRDGVARQVSIPQHDSFGVVVACVQTLVVAMLGGFVAVWLYSRRHSRSPTEKA
jgi:hypothetical protein